MANELHSQKKKQNTIITTSAFSICLNLVQSLMQYK